MVDDEKRITKLKAVLAQLRGRKNVQNRQLQTLLGEEGYARFLEEWREQQELRDTLKNKPDEISEYERRLKKATFAYGKADAASGQGRSAAAIKLMAISDVQFERLTEYLSEQIAGRADLECWLDRNVHYDAANAPSLSPDSFPCVITSRSLRKEGGGLLSVKRTKLQVKIDAVERVLEKMLSGDADESRIADRLATGRKLRGLAAD